jgi:hypothetical protein
MREALLKLRAVSCLLRLRLSHETPGLCEGGKGKRASGALSGPHGFKAGLGFELRYRTASSLDLLSLKVLKT